MPTLTGFRPSSAGFKFSNNNFPRVALKTITVLGKQIPIGDASNGLCGGMVFAVRDYFEAKMPIPPNVANPSSGPLYDYIVNRLIDSFNLPGGPLKYMDLMNPTLPDHETAASKIGLAPHGRAWRMIKEEWPRIKSDLDSGKLSPLGLVKVKSLDPFQLGKNHVVLAYGYNLNQNDLSINIYDPNFPNDDNVTISLNIGKPESTTSVVHSKSSTPIYSFFRTDYTFKKPVDYNWILSGPFAAGDDMQPGEKLQIDQAIHSSSGTYAFVFQGDGNLVLYKNIPNSTRKAIWASGTNGKGQVGICIIQGDGNLVIYDAYQKPIWSSDTWTHLGSRLVVQNDGNVVIYRPDGRAVWATNTVQR
ncbi:hypothetical protein V7161_04115 [Neobacillus drentensis]|uniref:hypothetical protein n=1 Tax=Neobacillus drentensis TaxID=220684 RepID=UPI003000564C